MVTIGEQYKAVQNFYKPIANRIRHMPYDLAALAELQTFEETTITEIT